MPAGCAAGIAAFNPGSTAGILTAAAAVLTVGAVLLTKEPQSAVRLLFGAVIIALGTPLLVLGAAFVAGRDIRGGAALIALGLSPIVFGAAVIAGHAMLARAAVVAFWPGTQGLRSKVSGGCLDFPSLPLFEAGLLRLDQVTIGQWLSI